MIAGHLNGKPFEAAMISAQCGCRLIEESKRNPDPEDAADQLFQGERLCAEWRCPLGGFSESESAESLSPECREALQCVERVTGASGFTTCPVASTHAPWVARSVRLWAWREKGVLPHDETRPPAALLRAVDVVDAAHNSRMTQEFKQREADLQKNANRK